MSKILIPWSHIEETHYSLDNLAWCLGCGHEHTGCEPDARRYICESCHKPLVMGPHTILFEYPEHINEEE